MNDRSRPTRSRSKGPFDRADDPDRSCEAADGIAQRQLHQVESRISRLRALEAELERMVVQCHGGKIAECRVIEVPADHAHCMTEHRGASA